MKTTISCSIFYFIIFSPAFAMSVNGVQQDSGEQRKCVAVSKKEVAALFDRWNNSLETGDAQKVAANYTHDAVLLPTLSPQTRLTDAERIDYFKSFLKKGPVGHIDSRTIRLGCDDAVDTGNYTFTFKDGSKARARYTFTYGWNGEKWLITSHHSSALPVEK